MADDRDEGESRESSPEPKKQRALPLASTSKFRNGADAELIEMVRTRPVLYDPTHAHYMDNPYKNALWTEIGEALRTSPNACKARWNNIRDQYRKALRRRMVHGKLQYKFAHLLTFMDPLYQSQFEADGLATIRGKKLLRDILEDTNTLNEEANENKRRKSEANQDAEDSDGDSVSNQSETVIDYDMFDKSANVSSSFTPANIPGSYSSSVSQSDTVDAFMAAIGPSLKGLSPYNLSMAKAEIFAIVHKYELKGIVGNGWTPPGVDPLP